MSGYELSVKMRPRPGEVLESWLGTLAAQLDMPFGGFLDFIGSPRDIDLRRPGLSLHLDDNELGAISASTGVEPEKIRAMTLARYDGHLVSIGRVGAQLRWSVWMPTRIRFCPACLKASGGVWQLRWRLPWCFVCDVHRCLLQDFCPECGQAQSFCPRWLRLGQIPSLRQCSMSIGDTPCTGDLTAPACTALADDDPLLITYGRLSSVLADSATTFGVYALAPASSLQVLSDLRLLAARMLVSMEAEAIDDVLDLDEHHSISARLSAQDVRPRDWAFPATFSSLAPAVITGTGIALALEVMGSESVRGASDRLCRVIGRRDDLTKPAAPMDLKHGRLSPAVKAVYLSAISERRTRSDQLRLRTDSAFPRYPGLEGVAQENVAAAFWRDWFLLLDARGQDLEVPRASLAPLLLIVGTRVSLEDACRLLGGQVTRDQHCAALKTMQTHPLWQNVLEAITRLADYLAVNASPINYQRRRDLSYENLLPIDRWADIRAHAGLTHDFERSWHLVRSWLFERVSGQPRWASPFDSALRRVVGEPRYARAYRDLLIERFTSEVIAMLDNEATCFLRCHGIVDEPVWWSPPLSLVGDLQLPGPDVTTISVAELHAALDENKMTTAAAARLFGVSTACIRLALERAPRNASSVRRVTQVDKLKGQLSPGKFSHLYEHDGLSFTAIAATFDVERHAVAAVAHEYNVEIRRIARHQPLTLDSAWFRHEYVDNDRTLTDIANEIGYTTAAVSTLAHRLGIPVIGHPRRRPG